MALGVKTKIDPQRWTAVVTLGISTSWWANKGIHGATVVEEALELGFRGMELEYRLTERRLREMIPFLGSKISVKSVHNVFPKTTDQRSNQDPVLLSSTDNEARLEAVNQALNTIHWARELGASAVVLHLGQVDMSCPTEKWQRLKRTGHRSEQEAFENLQRKTRKESKKRNLEAVLESLDTLNRSAQSKGVQLGLENRYHFHEIPDFAEIGMLLNAFQGGNVRYWHDMGHAHANEQLGITGHKDLLLAYGDQMAGVHIHDAKAFDDHRPPGSGEIAFDDIVSLIGPSVITILELHGGILRQDLMAGVQFLENLGISQRGHR